MASNESSNEDPKTCNKAECWRIACEAIAERSNRRIYEADRTIERGSILVAAIAFILPSAIQITNCLCLFITTSICLCASFVLFCLSIFFSSEVPISPKQMIRKLDSNKYETAVAVYQDLCDGYRDGLDKFNAAYAKKRTYQKYSFILLGIAVLFIIISKGIEVYSQ